MSAEAIACVCGVCSSSLTAATGFACFAEIRWVNPLVSQ